MSTDDLRKIRRALKRLIDAHSIAESDCAYNQLEQQAAHIEAVEALELLDQARLIDG